jgi:hypothetical protein
MTADIAFYDQTFPAYRQLSPGEKTGEQQNGVRYQISN